MKLSSLNFEFYSQEGDCPGHFLRLLRDGEKYRLNCRSQRNGPDRDFDVTDRMERFSETLTALTEQWDGKYFDDPYYASGAEYRMEYVIDGRKVSFGGSNACPPEFHKVLELFHELGVPVQPVEIFLTAFLKIFQETERS